MAKLTAVEKNLHDIAVELHHIPAAAAEKIRSSVSALLTGTEKNFFADKCREVAEIAAKLKRGKK